MKTYLSNTIEEEIRNLTMRIRGFKEIEPKLSDTEFKEKVSDLIGGVFDFLFILARQIDKKIPETQFFQEGLILQLSKPGPSRAAIISEATSFYLKQLLALDEHDLRDRPALIAMIEQYFKGWKMDLARFLKKLLKEGE
ncbi:MAG: hypothetical protein PHW04_08490 [Candidatus Wallbacteria bacterium]|nr:hypothetical protein [Candidatus Wallbacteria bacterium]